MKRYILIFLFLIVFAVSATLLLISCTPLPQQCDNSAYIRIHIRANSNSDSDQSVKLAVRDVLVQYLAPLAATCKTKEDMWKLIAANKGKITDLANATLISCGYTYQSNVVLKNEHFPQKTYGELTLPEGDYDAIIVNLGSGKGNNWWCVAFPPLCFVGANPNDSGEIKYKSWIAEMLKK